MLRTRLWYKLMLSFALVIGLGGVIVAFTINRTTNTAFHKMIREGDVAVANELSVSLGTYFETHNSWEGVNSIIQPYQHIYFQGRESPGASINNNIRNKMRNMGMGEYNGMRRQNQGVHVAITDPGGKILVTDGGSMQVVKLPTAKGTPIYSGSRIIGYVYVGSMIGTGLLPFQEEFINSSTLAISLSLIIMIILASIIGFFLIRHITGPVKKLTRVSHEISRGNLNVNIDVDRKDELGELAESFNAMAESLRKAEEWKRQIIADSAHELRTPLSLIQGRLEMMIDGIYTIDKEGVQLVYDETLTLTKLVKELSELSNAEAGAVHLSIEKHSVSDLLNFSGAFSLPGVQDKNISLKINVNDSVPPVAVDLQKMNQVLGNLISNAIRYTHTGGSITVSSWFDSSNSNIYISVEDTGNGIPKSEREKIFDRFYRIDNDRNRKSGGSGLGLAISKEIIRLHGGTIKAVDPLTRHGARIVISLPVAT